jgi:hypothetical protein
MTTTDLLTGHIARETQGRSARQHLTSHPATIRPKHMTGAPGGNPNSSGSQCCGENHLGGASRGSTSPLDHGKRDTHGKTVERGPKLHRQPELARNP